MKEMFDVFNMGHRLEIYCDKTIANDLISIAASYNVEAQIIGRCAPLKTKKLTIQDIEY